MRILSLDTSFSFFNFSVIENGKVKFIYYLDSERKTLQNLPKALEGQCVKPEEFDAFAVSVGVGYLTSLRIGVTFMKTLAYVLKKPIVAYENLHLIGRFTPVPTPKIPYLKVSTNIFYRVFDGKAVSEVRLHRGEKLKGTGVSLSIFSEEKIGENQFYHPFFPFSAYGGIYAHEHLREKPEGDDVFSIEPVYLKPPV
ncbi:tRNA A37 threonylcarbamoyladenosine modification protein TsaB [Hydrogenivirga caldilitoris]|uniref:tRNA A37 threonylcarbamoyladenosine modification protein TsaB n=1 Tax=Hydrogenivirga caldilitoris TaxID=246264 RepID=A0A497XP30_9AQUI|nr:tRNA (adenosine(37)-N6)-threonylcarbamoyltransferase complex dimerization subunit type 1 TsaB [Hydrogenivirga caldilitoris]RLJ70021.1 tRNA A37 threonylcarbamoyladenosine modification protein TsaB [Hydrogenivirga caldilitoris]